MAERGTPQKFRPVAAGREIPNRPTVRPIKAIQPGSPVALSAPQRRNTSAGGSARAIPPARTTAKPADSKATAFVIRSTISGVGAPAPGSHAPPLPKHRKENYRPLVRNTASETDAALQNCSSLAATSAPARSIADEIDDIDLDALFASFEASKPASSVSPANTTNAEPAQVAPIAPLTPAKKAPPPAPPAKKAPPPAPPAEKAPAASATTPPGQPSVAAAVDAPSEIHQKENQLAPSKPVLQPSRLRWFAVGAAFGMAVVIGTMRLAVSRGDHDVAIALARLVVGHGWNAAPAPAAMPATPVEVATPSGTMSSESPAAAPQEPFATDEAPFLTSEPVEVAPEPVQNPKPASHPEPAKTSVQTPAATTAERPERVEKKPVIPATPPTPKAAPAAPRPNVAVRYAPPVTSPAPPADKPKPQKSPAASAPASDPADIFGAALRP